MEEWIKFKARESASIFISSLQSAKQSAALADWLRAGAEW